MKTVITMRSGEKHYARGYASDISEIINVDIKNGDKFSRLEKDSIPTGQYFYIDPFEVESVKDET
jgi:hypothetical protein